MSRTAHHGTPGLKSVLHYSSRLVGLMVPSRFHVNRSAKSVKFSLPARQPCNIGLCELCKLPVGFIYGTAAKKQRDPEHAKSRKGTDPAKPDPELCRPNERSRRDRVSALHESIHSRWAMSRICIYGGELDAGWQAVRTSAREGVTGPLPGPQREPARARPRRTMRPG